MKSGWTLLALAVACLAGCARMTPAPQASSVVPTMSDEQIVLQHVHKSFPDPSVVKVATWGPHDQDGELGLDRQTATRMQLTDSRDPANGSAKAMHIIRIAYQRPTTADEKSMAKALGVTAPLQESMRMDVLYFLNDGRVVGSEDNAHGDNWMAVMKRRIEAAK